MPVISVNPGRFNQSWALAPETELLTTTGPGTWRSPPALAPGTTVLVQCIGGGGNGGQDDATFPGGGGGGGAYSEGELTLVSNTDYLFSVGVAGGDTFFGAASLASANVGAKGGANGSNAAGSAGAGGQGGQSSAGQGTTKRSGGDGVRGGGGAAGPDAAGNNASTINGGAGNGATNGGGAGGAGTDTTDANGTNGSDGTTWDHAVDRGPGGGGGQGGPSSAGATSAGGGGLYGGGGGGSGIDGGPDTNAGAGAQGIIRITYQQVPHWDWVDPYNPDYEPVDEAPATGLVAQYRADQITGVAEAGLVGTWPDMSGNGYDLTQATDANKPTLRGDQINGHSVVRFDGTGDWMRRASTPDVAQPYTIIAVAMSAAGSGIRNICGGDGSSGPRMSIDAEEQPYIAATTKLGDGSVLQLERTFFHVFEGGFDNSGGPFLKVQGYHTPYSGITIGTAAIDGFTIGAYNTGANSFWNGDIAEVLIYDHILDEDERNELYEYLAARYDLMIEKQIILSTTGAGTFQVPSDWNDGNNSIECIAGGAGGRDTAANSNGGGGGAYAKQENVELTRGNTYDCFVGAGGAAGTDGQDTWFNGTSLADCDVGAAKGLTTGVKGDRDDCVGETRYSGGTGGAGGATHGGGGGGGGAGHLNQGAAGGASSTNGGAGAGGGANGGGVGNFTTSTSGFGGGRGPDNLSADAGAAGAPQGGNGSNGGGGGGADSVTDASDNFGGNGGISNDYGPGKGSGGGGGGSGRRFTDTSNGSNGGNGAAYGGGGGGAGNAAGATQGTAGSGGQGVIIIHYTPIYTPLDVELPIIPPRVEELPATSDLALRFRADVGLTIEDDGGDDVVTAWEDISGNDRHMDMNGLINDVDNCPEYIPTVASIKNRPGVEYNLRFLITRLTTEIDLFTLPQPFSICVVAVPDSNTREDGQAFSYYGTGFSGNMCDSFRTSGARGGNIRYRGRGAVTPDVSGMSAGTTLDAITEIPLSNWTGIPVWFLGEFNGGFSKFYSYGVLEKEGNAGTNSLVGFGTGDTGSNYNGAGEKFYGIIAEIAVWDRVLTSAERETLSRYIGTRYGINSYVQTANNGGKPNGRGGVACRAPWWASRRTGVASEGSMGGGGGGGGCCMPVSRGCVQNTNYLRNHYVGYGSS